MTNQPCSMKLKNDIMKIMRERLKHFRVQIPSDFLTYNHFKRVVEGLDWNSSPGYPYIRNYTTNRQMFGVVDGIPSEDQMRHYYKMVMDKIENRKSDYIRVFVKPEPHTWKKIVQHRYRLIMSVSVLDQIIDAMLCKEFNEGLMMKYYDYPPKAGWTPLLGGWRYVPQKNVTATDKSCWDWTVMQWLIELILELRIDLTTNANEQWKELLAWRYRALYREAEFIFSNGLVMRQNFVGMMKSGCFNTIIDNSLMQMLLDSRIIAELDLPLLLLWVMGDDVLQETQPKEYFDRLSQLCLLKQAEPFAEFAGMRFKGTKVEPCYHGKHCYNLLHLDPRNGQAIAESYAYLYRRSKYRGIMEQILRELGVSPTDKQLDEVVDGII